MPESCLCFYCNSLFRPHSINRKLFLNVFKDKLNAFPCLTVSQGLGSRLPRWEGRGNPSAERTGIAGTTGALVAERLMVALDLSSQVQGLPSVVKEPERFLLAGSWVLSETYLR